MFRLTCGDCRLLSLLQAGHGCGLHPAFPAPSVFWGGDLQDSGEFRRENVVACHCEERKRRRVRRSSASEGGSKSTASLARNDEPSGEIAFPVSPVDTTIACIQRETTPCSSRQQNNSTSP